MPDAETNAPAEAEAPPITFAEFLEAVPPSVWRHISDLRINTGGEYHLATPAIQLHCSSEHCSGMRFFATRMRGESMGLGISKDVFLDYFCRNCGRSMKTYALWLSSADTGNGGRALKYGEWPVFGPPTPSRLISMVGPDREAFLKGRRSENEGLGVGAYAYYRRVVENQKDRLLDEIIRVAERLKAKPETIAVLVKAKGENQFSKAVEMVKDIIPESLLIDGHNPMTLLHSALSEGLHAKSDSECLELATSIRVVLQELADRAGAALKDHAELKSALSRLLNR